MLIRSATPDDAPALAAIYGHACEHGCVESVGLGELSRRLGKIADLPWIHSHHWQAGAMQCVKRRLVVAAGGFQHDLARL